MRLLQREQVREEGTGAVAREGYAAEKSISQSGSQTVQLRACWRILCPSSRGLWHHHRTYLSPIDQQKNKKGPSPPLPSQLDITISINNTHFNINSKRQNLKHILTETTVKFATEPPIDVFLWYHLWNRNHRTRLMFPNMRKPELIVICTYMTNFTCVMYCVLIDDHDGIAWDLRFDLRLQLKISLSSYAPYFEDKYVIYDLRVIKGDVSSSSESSEKSRSQSVPRTWDFHRDLPTVYHRSDSIISSTEVLI